ncbi:filamin-A-interacting protein 1-like [Centruroides vittatus]|uniref:filamin-A-interacting protein 1-like n=1 Tax=Centruroides vittatus TaxID=120091 RepID=UPI003510540E
MVEQSIRGDPNLDDRRFSIEEKLNYTLCPIVKNSDVSDYLKQSDERLTLFNSEPMERIETQTSRIDKSNDLLQSCTESVAFSIRNENERSEMPISDKDFNTTARHCRLHGEDESGISLPNEGNSHYTEWIDARDRSIECLRDERNRLSVELASDNSEKQLENENSTAITHDGIPTEITRESEQTKNDSDVCNGTKEVLEINREEEQKVNKFPLELDTSKDDETSQLKIASISENESDYLILEIDEKDTITEQWETEDEIISDEIFDFNSQNKMSPAVNTNKRENVRDRNIVGNTVDSTLIAEVWNKGHDKICKKWNKRNWRSEDPTEKLDTDDPEWERVKTLTTEEERYRAVKNRWHSHSVPNPHKDLTSQSFRLRRSKKEGSTAHHNINRKRSATGDPVGIIRNKRQKTESVPCTKILDRKIKDEKRSYRKKIDMEESIYFKELHKIKYDGQKNRNDLLEAYKKKFLQNVHLRSIYAGRAKEWKEYIEMVISDREKKQKEAARKRYVDEKDKLYDDHRQKVDKLYKAREEIFKFNQFYCGFNQLNPTVVEKKRAEEIKKTEEMYKAFAKMYSPARF